MNNNLESLLKKASQIKMTDEERAQQRESFAYGNTKIGNDLITKEMIRSLAKIIDRQIVLE